MKNQTLSRLLSLSAAAFVVAGSLAPAAGLARGRSTTIHGTRGGTYQRQIDRSPGKFTQTTSVTNAAGQTVSRSLAAHADRAAGSLATSASTTLADGRTASRSFDTHKTDTGRTTSARATGPNGATGSKQVIVSTQDGVTTRTVTKSATPPQP